MKPWQNSSVAGLLLLAVILGVVAFLPLVTAVEPQITPTDYAATVIIAVKVTFTPFQPQKNTHTPVASGTHTTAPLPSQTPSPSDTFEPSPTSSPTQTPIPLDEASLTGIAGRWAAYNLDCEARSAVDWAAYFGYLIDEIAFFNALPRSDDPDLGFVGNVEDPWGSIPPDSYGVHAKPVARLLRDYGLDAKAVHGLTWDELRAEISQGRPVIAWVVGRVGLGTPVPYISIAGRETTVARFEHTVIVTGYTKTEVKVLDGYWNYSRGVQDFLASWSVLGNMAIVWSETGR